MDKKHYCATLALGTALAVPLLATGGCSRAVADEPAKAAPQPAPFEKEIEAFEQQDKKAPPPADAVLFIGSSSFRRWSTLAHDFPEIPVINRGFGGSTIADSVRYVPRIVLPYKPRLIVMFAGGNDLDGGKTPAQVTKDFEAFVAAVRATLPAVPIAYISINPSIKRWKEDDKIRETNRLIADYMRTQPKLTFIESYSGMLGPDGKPQKALLIEDGLHLNSDGYKAWTAIIKAPILKLYEDVKTEAAA